ncbi:hypothetical protein [Arcobacter sp. FWKO B]|uniref:hypothetical protein n=1 Tax=Arcobacter sp. FWKO B TaxID=2593672 RepID=UPI0018A5F2BC|nr:hypothetical protein [Arcobacter sp. FWKO B]QOG11223.1 hypothetical protein FWKOB_00315 [Arcobacter sp. FWKO B]
MFGNVWLSTAFIVSAMFLAGVSYKAYNDIQTARDIQQSYHIISEIKELLAKQYNKPIQDITRDEIIAFLPSGGSWEKILLLDRDPSGKLANDALVDEDGKFVLSEEDKIRLFALRAKLKNFDTTQEIKDNANKTITFDVATDKINIHYKDNIIQTQLMKAIEILDIHKDDGGFSTTFDKVIEDYTPYDAIYQDLRLDGESDEIYENAKKQRQKEYFKGQLISTLEKKLNSKDILLYDKLKGL